MSSKPATDHLSEAAPPDRRRSQRRPHAVEAFLSSPTGGERVRVISFDLSRHGVGLCVKGPLASDTYRVLEMAMGAQTMVGEVRIVSCRAEPGGSYRVHAMFC